MAKSIAGPERRHKGPLGGRGPARVSRSPLTSPSAGGSGARESDDRGAARPSLRRQPSPDSDASPEIPAIARGRYGERMLELSRADNGVEKRHCSRPLRLAGGGGRDAAQDRGPRLDRIPASRRAAPGAKRAITAVHWLRKPPVPIVAVTSMSEAWRRAKDALRRLAVRTRTLGQPIGLGAPLTEPQVPQSRPSGGVLPNGGPLPYHRRPRTRRVRRHPGRHQ
jgi:hypothetical protein